MGLFHLSERDRPLLSEVRWLFGGRILTTRDFSQFLPVLRGLRLESCRDRRLGRQYLLSRLLQGSMLDDKGVYRDNVKNLTRALQVTHVLVSLVSLSPLLGLGFSQQLLALTLL